MGAISRQASMGVGTQGALPLADELFATDRFGERENHCPQLCTYWRGHQAPSDSSNPAMTQMALVKLDNKQNQMS